MNQDPFSITRKYIEMFITGQLTKNKPTTAATRYRSLAELHEDTQWSTSRYANSHNSTNIYLHTNSNQVELAFR